MDMVVMSKRELNRLDVLARLDSDRLTARAAAELMTITPRQTYRLLRRYRDGGASAIANQRRGRPSNNRLLDVVRDHAIALVRELYADFGPTFAAEKLAVSHLEALIAEVYASAGMLASGLVRFQTGKIREMFELKGCPCEAILAAFRYEGDQHHRAVKF
jgi:hypothetical protein